ncbi:hypothetical protein [Longimicrobium sp.]|uniref:hypothetical protein n=1 Tax=Longimicrobium sp. TaxID=2029185 RepID=UPI002CEAB4DD|nr:hypothetical protein [Longimicrobium sp.]HSU13057.1 hypothetical protein [Longimicrobium sp.]
MHASRTPPPGGTPTRAPFSGARRLAALAALLAAAACADATTAVAPSPAPFRAAASGETVVGTWNIPIEPTSNDDDLDWTNTGIVTPHAGKYRLLITGVVSVTLNPQLKEMCPDAVANLTVLGDWGPAGVYPGGNTLRVRTSRGVGTPEFPWTKLDATSIESQVDLPAGTAVWVRRDIITGVSTCYGGPWIGHYLLTSSQVITVTEMATQPDESLVCKGADGSAAVERGTPVRCVFHSTRRSYTVLAQRATGKGFTVAETPNASRAAGADWVWEGNAVASTHVEMRVSLEGEQKTFAADFTAKPRDWPKLTVGTPTVTEGMRGGMQPYPPSDGRGELGNALPEMDPAKIAAVRLSRPTAGPNTGLMYMLDPWPVIDFSIYLHPAIFDHPERPSDPSQVWHADQNGRGSGTCTQAMFTTLEAQVRRHEGATQAPDSHWGVAQRFFQGSNVEQELEQTYAQTTNPDLVLQDAYDRLGRMLRKQLDPLQEAFDKTDTPLLIASLGCKLDHNRSDP